MLGLFIWDLFDEMFLFLIIGDINYTIQTFFKNLRKYLFPGGANYTQRVRNTVSLYLRYVEYGVIFPYKSHILFYH